VKQASVQYTQMLLGKMNFEVGIAKMSIERDKRIREHEVNINFFEESFPTFFEKADWVASIFRTPQGRYFWSVGKIHWLGRRYLPGEEFDNKVEADDDEDLESDDGLVDDEDPEESMPAEVNNTLDEDDDDGDDLKFIYVEEKSLEYKAIDSKSIIRARWFTDGVEEPDTLQSNVKAKTIFCWIRAFLSEGNLVLEERARKKIEEEFKKQLESKNEQIDLERKTRKSEKRKKQVEISSEPTYDPISQFSTAAVVTSSSGRVRKFVNYSTKKS